MAGPASDPKDPRFRPYRVAMYVLYIAVAGGFGLLLVVNVARSVMAMTPGELPAAEPTLTFRECLDQTQELWKQLDERREQLAQHLPPQQAEQDWYKFRTEWLKTLRERESHCAIHSHDRAALANIFERLVGLQDLYTTHAIQFAGQVGPYVEGLKKAIASARQSPAAGRF